MPDVRSWMAGGIFALRFHSVDGCSSKLILHSSVGIMRCLLTAHDTQESGPVPPQGPSLRQKSRSPQLFCKRLLRNERAHSLCHSFASHALALGETLPVIGKPLGHSDIETTARYAHLARDSIHDAAERIADSIAADIL